MRTRTVPAFVLVLLSALHVGAADLGPSWSPQEGDWHWTREVIPMIRQGSETGTCIAVWKDVIRSGGAWRATVEPALGAQEVGIWIHGTQDTTTGFLVTLGGNPGVGGFALRSADGGLLWEDRWAPWSPYHPYVLEGVIERGRIRAQMFQRDGVTLVSQSPWVDVPEEVTARSGIGGLYTRDAIARFWGWGRADEPLSPIVADAPNKRRLIQDENSPWLIVGPGSWMWTTAEKRRLRQGAVVERSSALSRTPRSAEGTWECRVQVDPGAGGAGLLFLTNPQVDRGFIAWLGGAHGDGSLMLYRLPAKALWGGEQGNWKYDTEYVIRAETRAGEVRAQLLQADGATIIQETPWMPMTENEAARDGLTGFMTWRGAAEFWGFSEETVGQTVVSGAGPGPAPSAPSPLGDDWIASGDGSWSWDDDKTRLRRTGSPGRAIALNTAISGVVGAWRCRVTIGEGAEAAGLVFQADKRLKEGFVALLTSEGFSLQRLGGKTLWEDGSVEWRAGVEYVIEGEVMTDRVAVRLLAADGETLLSECPAVYVHESNNHRAGVIGVLSRGGPAEFRGWELR